MSKRAVSAMDGATYAEKRCASSSFSTSVVAYAGIATAGFPRGGALNCCPSTASTSSKGKAKMRKRVQSRTVSKAGQSLAITRGPSAVNTAAHAVRSRHARESVKCGIVKDTWEPAWLANEDRSASYVRILRTTPACPRDRHLVHRALMRHSALRALVRHSAHRAVRHPVHRALMPSSQTPAGRRRTKLRDLAPFRGSEC